MKCVGTSYSWIWCLLQSNHGTNCKLNNLWIREYAVLKFSQTINTNIYTILPEYISETDAE